MTLEELRKKKYVSQMKLAADLGINVSTVSSWERGRKRPEMYNILKLASYFGMLPEEIDAIIDATIAAHTGMTDQFDAVE
jgi:transcriptional regulator with XRE-family HTH domain